MRVLHVASYFPPDRIGGVGEVAAHLHRGLLEAGHDSRVLTSGTSRDDPRICRMGRSPGRFALASLRGWRTATEVAVIHAHHGEALPFLLSTRFRRRRPRILLTMHIDNRALGDSYRPVTVQGHRIAGGWSAWLQGRVKSRLKWVLDRAAMALADEVTFICRSAATDLLGSAKAKRARVLYNGLPDRPGSAVPPGVEPMELLYVGTAGMRKRTDLLPLVLAAVRRDHPGARLRIVGFDTDSQPVFRELVATLGLADAIVDEGSVRSEDAEKFYRSARVLIVPSAHEGLPMVIMEAFRAGIPCVATDVGGIAEIVEDGRNGFLVDVDDPGAMAKKCAQILADPTQAESMGRAAERTVRDRFTLDQQVTGYEAIYASMVTP
jgi:glycosyltransferase involved in cell wall biosynthesis